MRNLYVAGLLYVALSAALIAGRDRPSILYSHSAAPVTFGGDAGTWFQAMRPYCNPVEVETRHRRNPPPEGLAGTGFSAACYALAGKIGTARELILSVDAGERYKAAGIVFDVAHPVADAGDDLAAGPVMELVVEFWPNHYMALYHAGIARWERGEEEGAREYLENFLEYYHKDDGWRTSALGVLERIGR